MDEALILKKLDELSTEVRNLKSGVKEEIRQEIVQASTSSLLGDCVAELDGHSKEDLTHLVRNLLANVEMLNSLLATVKGTMELKDEVEPIAKIAYPMALETMTEFSENLDMEQVKPLIRNTLSNLENFNTALGMLKAGMELKDEIEPIAKIAYPMALDTMTEISENLDMEQVKPLIRNTLGNLENFNTALSMLKAGMELKDDIEPLAKLSLPMAIEFMSDLSGLMKISGTALESLKEIPISSEQADAISDVIRNIDLSKPNRVTMFGMLKKLNDSKVQEALGAVFTVLEVLGSILETYRGTTK